MRLDDQRRSSNIEDRRGQRGGGGGGGNGMGLISFIGSRFGIGGIVIAGLVFFLGLNFGPPPIQNLLRGLIGGGQVATEPGKKGAPTDVDGQFLAAVLGSTEDVWAKEFAAGKFAHYGFNGREYAPTTLVAFSGGVGTQCGNATSAVGPFYCPADRKVYIDTTFFQEMKTRFRAPGDFAQAYVIAHEVGHHIQNITPIMSTVSGGGRPSNATQVKIELQADCFAGVWARIAGSGTTRAGLPVMEAGDLEEGLNAANAIGDDTLQRQARGTVQPESFTHGTSEQRKRWLRKGFDTGDVAQCDTFNAAEL